LLDFGVEGRRNIPYLIMDYAPQGTLRQQHPRGQVVPLFQVVSYGKQIAAALQYAHEHKVVHRDVKPENILVGAGREILLADFGIAVVESSRQQTLDMIAGTISYMAPEQLHGKVMAASDQYALAVVVYEWLCGRPPFTGSYTEVALQHERDRPPSLRGQVGTIPVAVEQVVFKALAKDPQHRFPGVQAFADALEQASTLTVPPPLARTPVNRPEDEPTVQVQSATSPVSATPPIQPLHTPAASVQETRVETHTPELTPADTVPAFSEAAKRQRPNRRLGASFRSIWQM
jgi:serine/threonine protein kinase